MIGSTVVLVFFFFFNKYQVSRHALYQCFLILFGSSLVWSLYFHSVHEKIEKARESLEQVAGRKFSFFSEAVSVIFMCISALCVFKGIQTQVFLGSRIYLFPGNGISSSSLAMARFTDG